MSPRARSYTRRAVARLWRPLAGDDRGLRILTYHRVNDVHPTDRLTVRSDAFAAQMEVIARSGRPVIPLTRAVEALRTGDPLPAGALAVTFDDGFEDNFSVALPVLDHLHFPATFFVVTGYLGSPAETLDRYRGCCAADRMLDWKQVQEMQAGRHEIGGHSRTHRELATLTPNEVRAELLGCAQDIEEKTGRRPSLFCYPRGSHNATVRRLVEEIGFAAACSVRPGVNTDAADLFALKRTEISGGDDLSDFRLKLEGGFDGWHRLLQWLTRAS